MSEVTTADTKWTREELILALELYQSTDRVGVKSDADVEALSETLRGLSIHDGAAGAAKFRSATGVKEQVNRFAKCHGGAAASRSQPSKKMEGVWALYGDRPEATRTVAAAIRSAFGS